MPKLQQTFTLIDPTVRMQNLVDRRPDQALPELAPWMTSKQAQKLHREKTKQARVSREEQRRLDREEQARIKAEFEKEKASKRARFVRDKKKEKEQKALELKRKKGLPLVDVRPSQSTISWFVRPGAPTKRKLDEVEGVAEEQPAPRPHPSQRIQRQQMRENVRPAPSLRPAPAPITPGASKIFSPTSTLLPPSSQILPHRDITNIATLAPPPSTQFVIEHLEDFLPTPSQMDRELEEEYGTPKVVSKPARATSASRSRPPVPLFCDSAKGKSTHSPPRVSIPLAPLPAPVHTMKRVNRTKNTVDFFASQDWQLSSQDIRDLEGTTTTPCKPSKVPSPMVTVQRLATTIEVPEQRHEDHSAKAPEEPPISTREARRRSPEDFAPLHESSQSVWDSQGESVSQANIDPRPSRRKSQRSTPPPEPSLPELPGHGSPQATPPKDVTRKTSSPIRFFGSSGDGVELLMALAESRKLAAEEAERKNAEKKRLAEEKLAEEWLAKELARDKRKLECQAQPDSHVEETAHRVLAPLSQCSIQHDDTEEPSLAGQGPLQPQIGAEEAINVPGMAVAASQAETDYGDDDFAELEEETLTLLDAVASTTTATTATAASAAPSTAAPQVTAQSGPPTYTISFNLEDDSWLANDDEFDF